MSVKRLLLDFSDDGNVLWSFLQPFSSVKLVKPKHLFVHINLINLWFLQEAALKCWSLPLFIVFFYTGSIDIKVEEYTNSVKLSCPGGEIRDQNYKTHQSLELLYKDENTGKYDCMKDDSAVSHIFVKFRSKFQRKCFVISRMPPFDSVTLKAEDGSVSCLFSCV